MNILLYSDLHLTKSSIFECEAILAELYELKTKYKVDVCINLGDTFDSTKPTSDELDLFSSFVKRLDCPQIILAADSHESTTPTDSVINHFGILVEGVEVKKEYKDSEYLFCGHFIFSEAKRSFGATQSTKDYANFKYAFCGHQHTFEEVAKRRYQLGSCRYVDFAEAQDEHKFVAIITNYQTIHEKVNFIALTSCIPMTCLRLSKNGVSVATTLDKIARPEQPSKEIQAVLDALAKNTKVKVIIEDFDSFRQFLPLVNKYTAKFDVFKYETKFEVVSINNQKKQDTEIKNFKDSLNQWLDTQNVDKSIRNLLLEELK